MLLRWIKAQLQSHDFTHDLKEASECFTNGRVLCALINRYRPDLLDFATLDEHTVEQCNEMAFAIFEKDLLIPRAIAASDTITLDGVDSRTWLTYLEHVCEVFRGEIPHVKHPKLVGFVERLKAHYHFVV